MLQVHANGLEFHCLTQGSGLFARLPPEQPAAVNQLILDWLR